MHVDIEKLFNAMKQHFALGSHSLHGPEHWIRVEQNGVEMAPLNGADETVVRLFAIFHALIN